jgi:hypothetical protein
MVSKFNYQWTGVSDRRIFRPRTLLFRCNCSTLTRVLSVLHIRVSYRLHCGELTFSLLFAIKRIAKEITTLVISAAL